MKILPHKLYIKRYENIYNIKLSKVVEEKSVQMKSEFDSYFYTYI